MPDNDHLVDVDTNTTTTTTTITKDVILLRLELQYHHLIAAIHNKDRYKKKELIKDIQECVRSIKDHNTDCIYIHTTYIHTYIHT